MTNRQGYLEFEMVRHDVLAVPDPGKPGLVIAAAPAASACSWQEFSSSEGRCCINLSWHGLPVLPPHVLPTCATTPTCTHTGPPHPRLVCTALTPQL
jgi:hypothetical protein